MLYFSDYPSYHPPISSIVILLVQIILLLFEKVGRARQWKRECSILLQAPFKKWHLVSSIILTKTIEIKMYYILSMKYVSLGISHTVRKNVYCFHSCITYATSSVQAPATPLHVSAGHHRQAPATPLHVCAGHHRQAPATPLHVRASYSVACPCRPPQVGASYAVACPCHHMQAPLHAGFTKCRRHRQAPQAGASYAVACPGHHRQAPPQAGSTTGRRHHMQAPPHMQVPATPLHVQVHIHMAGDVFKCKYLSTSVCKK